MHETRRTVALEKRPGWLPNDGTRSTSSSWMHRRSRRLVAGDDNWWQHTDMVTICTTLTLDAPATGLNEASAVGYDGIHTLGRTSSTRRIGIAPRR